jgi:hypothetical protein
MDIGRQHSGLANLDTLASRRFQHHATHHPGHTGTVQLGRTHTISANHKNIAGRSPDEFLIGCVGLLSFGLALFGVRLFGYPFGYMALIGSLGMMGLAINGAIVVLSALKAHPQALAGNLDAAADVVVDATRHIVSTTVTTIGGFVPLIIAGGTFWPPLATAIAGGVGGSAIIALYMVPAVALAMERRRRQSAEPDAEVLPWVAPHQRHPPSAA